jgi:hypothetical protein
MKKALLTGALLALMAVAAQAQATFEYNRRDHNSSLRITFSGYSYSGYGYGGYGYGGYGTGYGYSGFGPGLVGTYRGGTYSFGVQHVWPDAFGYGYGYPVYSGPGYYSGYGLYSYGTPPGLYGGYPRGPYRRAPAGDYYPGPLRPAGVADRAHEYASAKEIEEGRRRFKLGDYRGAVEEFRSAVIAHTDNPVAQAWFAIALALTGDGRNADKALRAAAGRAPFAAPDLKGLFRDERERSRAMALLGKLSGEGALTAAYVESLAGNPDRLKQMAEKDASAKKLLGP